MAYIIRRAEDGDADDVLALLSQVHAVHEEIRPDLFKKGERKYSAAQLKDIFSDPDSPVFVCEGEGKVLGYAFCRILREADPSRTAITTLYLDDLCVDEGARGGGIGHKLLKHVENFAAECGAYNLTLHVYEGNDSAKKFYLSAGMGVQYFALEKIIKR